VGHFPGCLGKYVCLYVCVSVHTHTTEQNAAIKPLLNVYILYLLYVKDNFLFTVHTTQAQQ